MLLLAADANFCLKNRIRNNEIDDPSLGPGWGYWVEPTKYETHLKKYVNEKDVCCFVWARIFSADCQAIGKHLYRLRRSPSEGHSVNDRPACVRRGRMCLRQT
jgi:hypothetical protein